MEGVGREGEKDQMEKIALCAFIQTPPTCLFLRRWYALYRGLKGKRLNLEKGKVKRYVYEKVREVS